MEKVRHTLFMITGTSFTKQQQQFLGEIGVFWPLFEISTFSSCCGSPDCCPQTFLALDARKIKNS